jgi:hypothetical protein
MDFGNSGCYRSFDRGLSKVSVNRRAIRDRVRNEAEQLTRSRALAVSITPDLIYVEVSVRRAAAVVHERLANPIVIDQIMKQPDAIKRISGLMRLAKIEFLAMLQRFSTELWRLDGEASATTFQLITILHQWNQMLDRWLIGMEASRAAYLANDGKLLTGQVQALLLVSTAQIGSVGLRATARKAWMVALRRP